MGLATRHTGSASVEVARPSQLLVIQRLNYEALLRDERDLQTEYLYLGSALNLIPHLHVLMMDGVYARHPDTGGPTCVEATDPPVIAPARPPPPPEFAA